MTGSIDDLLLPFLRSTGCAAYNRTKIYSQLRRLCCMFSVCNSCPTSITNMNRCGPFFALVPFAVLHRPCHEQSLKPHNQSISCKISKPIWQSSASSPAAMQFRLWGSQVSIGMEHCYRLSRLASHIGKELAIHGHRAKVAIGAPAPLLELLDVHAD